MNWTESVGQRSWPTQHFLGGTCGKLRKPSVIKAGVTNEIRTEHLENTSLEDYHYGDLLGPGTPGEKNE
jgi:hypothetical protein